MEGRGGEGEGMGGGEGEGRGEGEGEECGGDLEQIPKSINMYEKISQLQL